MVAYKEDIRREPLLKRRWDFKSRRSSDLPRGILITGPGSFIGSHVVKHLQDLEYGSVYLLLRAGSEKEAVRKMQHAFDNWQLGNFRKDAFIILMGDVTQKLLGLPTNRYSEVKEQTGKVLHLAMTPMYHLPYRHFQRVWVPELEKMITFCGNKNTPKSLHYASSFNAGFFVNEEDFRAVNTNAWQSGYAGFKWVAREAINNAFSQNLNGCIYDIPLVLGTANRGLSPRHYSIWMILDIFLKTGRYFDFTFRIIPVNVLAEIMVFNLISETANESICFIRPVLNEPVTDKLLSLTAANILGLKRDNPENIRELYPNKLRFDFLMPANFYELLDKVDTLPQILPPGFNASKLPPTLNVFISNLNNMLVRNNELKGEALP